MQNMDGRRMILGEVCILTRSVRNMSNFYKALLDVDNGDDDCVHQTIIRDETMLTVLLDNQNEPHAGQNICLAFTVEDVDCEYLRVKALGMTVLQPPKTQAWGARNMCIKDPDGNKVYLRSIPKRGANS